jgi:hypothetical protein
VARAPRPRSCQYSPPLPAACSLPLAAALAGLAGCVPVKEHACTAIGCGYALQVTFSRPGAWAAGGYRVEVTADGATGACDVDLPLACDRVQRCEGTRDWFLILSGCALDPGQHLIGGVVFSRGTPAVVDVTVRQGDRSLGAGRFTPVYATGQPNGPDCEPVCRQAKEAATLVLEP